MDTIRQEIILYQILKTENLDFTEETYKARLEKFAEELGMKVEEVEAKYSKDEMLENFRFEVVNEFVFSSCELVKEQ
jgi:FKBP-type peptidyl-prolyl cis-trans isomerase (trigger factor)